MWFILSLVAGLTFAANRLIVRSVFTQSSNPLAFGAVHELLAGLFLLPIALFYFSLPQSPQIWMALSAGVFLIFLTDLFAFLALRNIEASLLQIINQLRHVVILFGAFLLFTEIISFTKILATLLIILGIFIALKGKSNLMINKGTIYGVLSTICISFALLFIKMASVDVAPAFSASLGFIVAGVLIYFLLLVRGERPAHFLPATHRKELFLAAGIFAVFELVLFIALAIGEASRVSPITQSSLIFTILGGYIFLNERSHMRQKIIGSAFIALGIGMMYFI